MSIKEIIANREQLETDLRLALSSMEKNNNVRIIRAAIQRNQALCPHQDSVYNWARVEGRCPYCGKKL